MTHFDVLQSLLEDGTVWRLKDLKAQGLPASVIHRAVGTGAVERVSLGTYRRPGAGRMPGADIAAAVVRVPRGVICMHSAAVLHGLANPGTLRDADHVWIAVPSGIHTPRITHPPVRYMRWRPEHFRKGILQQAICGVEARVTDLARTVVDLVRMPHLVDSAGLRHCIRRYMVSGRPVTDLFVLANAFGIRQQMAQAVQNVPEPGADAPVDG